MLDFSTLKSLKIGGVGLVKLTINGVLAWKKGFKNWVKFSINADGSIYNNGLGYKDGYRIRSGGAEATNNEGSCTGYIPIKANDVVRMSGWTVLGGNSTSANAINVYNSSFTNLGQAVHNNPNSGYGIFAATYAAYGWRSVVENPTGVYSWTVPPDSKIAYMRVTGRTKANGSKMIITVNEEIT